MSNVKEYASGYWVPLSPLDSMFAAWTYNDAFHIFTGLLFYSLVISSLFLGVVRFINATRAMIAVEKISKEKWRSCECTQDGVKSHLLWIMFCLSIHWFVVFLIGIYVFYFTWAGIRHEAHIIICLVVIVYLMDTKWGKKSIRHFRGLSFCKGNVAYHVRNNTLNRELHRLKIDAEELEKLNLVYRDE